jgi:N-acetylglucosamine kinase-like BadF-type ATPase
MYVIGIDGGGTKTKACLMDEGGNILGIGISGPSSIDTVSLEVSIENIRQAILESFGTMEYTLEGAYAGLGGIVTKQDSLKVSTELSKLDFFQKDAPILSENDTRTALAGGLATREGIAIIIGTGSVAFGRNEKGEEWLSGGFGYKEGDAGSSYDLGRQCLKYLARAVDGRIEITPFITSLNDTLKTDMDRAKLFDKINELWHDRTTTAGLAPFVTTYANKGDTHALEIVDKATSELSMLIEAIYKKVSFKAPQVAIIGSLGNAKGVFNESFIQKVKSIDQSISVIPQKLDPAVGAALQALKLKDIKITEEMVERYELRYE